MDGNSRLMKVGVILDDSSATDSRSANCFSLFPDAGISTGRERYGEMSAMLELRREDMGGFRAVATVENDAVMEFATAMGDSSLEPLSVWDVTSDSLESMRSKCFSQSRGSRVGICLALESSGNLTSVSLKVGTREDQSGVCERLDGEADFGNGAAPFTACSDLGSTILEAEMESEFKSRAKCGSRGSTRTPFSSTDPCLVIMWSLVTGMASLYCGEGVCGSPVSAEDELDSCAPLSPDV